MYREKVKNAKDQWREDEKQTKHNDKRQVEDSSTSSLENHVCIALD